MVCVAPGPFVNVVWFACGPGSKVAGCPVSSGLAFRTGLCFGFCVKTAGESVDS